MTEIKIRKPAVAGRFYSSGALELKKQVEACIDKGAPQIDAIGCVLPHAGYMYSGLVAGSTVSRIKIKEKAVLIGPNHTGGGKPFSIMAEGRWQMPFGDVKINEALTQEILKRNKYLEDDELAHLHEHSLEVELPFLQYFKKDIEIVPIVVMRDNIDILKGIGRDLALAIKELALEKSTVIIASSDMTHYESKAQAKDKDEQAIEAILGLNEDGLMEKVKDLEISMCGYAPVIVMLSAAKALGAKKAELVKYQTSGDVTHDEDSVVGYAGIIVY